MLFYSSFLKDNLKAAQANNNFYADAGVNFGYTKSSSKINSHNESVVVTTIRGKDENSSITYNNVKNVEYVGTQAQDTKIIYICFFKSITICFFSSFFVFFCCINISS